MFTYPPVESISEFKLVSSNFPQYSRTRGFSSRFITTRSGTNQVHGSLWEYFRNDVFDARGFIARTTPINQAERIWRAHSAVRRAAENIQRTQQDLLPFSSTTVFVIGQASRTSWSAFRPPDMIRGDFSKVTRNGQPVIIYDPATTRPDGMAALPAIRSPEMSCPQNQIQRGFSNLLRSSPPPTNSGQLNDFQVVGAGIRSRCLHGQARSSDHATTIGSTSLSSGTNRHQLRRNVCPER